MQTLNTRRARNSIANKHRQSLAQLRRDQSEDLYVLNTSDLNGSRPKGVVLITAIAGDREIIVKLENCHTGDTLIPTEKGLLRIDEMAGDISNVTPGEIRDIDVKTGSIYNPEKAIRWKYSGVHPTIEITTERGNTITCTRRHPNLVFNSKTAEFEWKKASECSVGDYLCINPKQITRKTKLKLNLNSIPSIVGSYGHRQLRPPKKPEYMTPELAFIIGALVSEGNVSDGYYGTYGINFDNNDLAFHKKYNEMFENVFGVTTRLAKIYENGMKLVINGKLSNCMADNYRSSIASKPISYWFNQLGMNTTTGKGKISKLKKIPKAILQADEQSQLAFLAAYLEGDGSVDNKINGVLVWYSSSKKLIQEMQIMLNSHGFISKILQDKVGIWRLQLNRMQSSMLWPRIEPYMVTKTLEIKPDIRSKSYGIPNKFWKELIKSRKVSSHGPKGSKFLNDNNKEIFVKGHETDWYSFLKDRSNILYEHLDRKDSIQFEEFSTNLKLISKSGYEKLKQLLKLKYWFTPIVKIRKGKKLPVYDLHMDTNKEPAFIANGLICHNTWIPRNLASYMERRQLLQNPDFLRCVNNGIVTAIPTDIAEEILEDQDAKDEADLLALNASRVSNAEEIVENRRSPTDIKSPEIDQIMANRQRMLSQGKGMEEGISPPVVSVMGQENLSSRERFTALRNLENIMSKNDYHYVIARTNKEETRILSWARKALEELDDEDEEAEEVKPKKLKSKIRKFRK